MTIYCQVVENHLLDKYARDDIVAKKDSEMAF